MDCQSFKIATMLDQDDNHFVIPQIITAGGGDGEKPPEKFSTKILDILHVQEPVNSLKTFKASNKGSVEDQALVIKIRTYLSGDEIFEISPHEPNLMNCHSNAVSIAFNSIPKSNYILFLCASKFDKKSKLFNLPSDVAHYILKMKYLNFNYEIFKAEITNRHLKNNARKFYQIDHNGNDIVYCVKLQLEVDKYNKKLDSQIKHLDYNFNKDSFLIKTKPVDDGCCQIL